MLKRVALLTTLLIAILIPLLLFLPTSFRITVYNSDYYENCSESSASDNPCKTLDPPVVIEKREPFVRAWWNKSQTERAFPLRVATAEWEDRGATGLGRQTAGTLAVLIVILQLLIYAGIIYLFISTLLRAFRLKGSEKIAWICLIIFVFPFGSIIYALTKPETK